MYKDYLGKELNIGDPVIYITPNYRDFSQGVIIRFTEKFVIVSRSGREIKQRSVQLIKVR